MEFSEILKELIKAENINLNQLSLETKIPSSRLNMYYHNKQLPTSKKLIAIADYFNVSVDYLLGREKPSVPPENFTSQEQELIAQFRKMNVQKQGEAISFFFSFDEN